MNITLKMNNVVKCVDCRFCEQHDEGKPAYLRSASICRSRHDCVVGDGVEGGSEYNTCWQERAVGDPARYSFRCGPYGRFFEPKEPPILEK